MLARDSLPIILLGVVLTVASLLVPRPWNYLLFIPLFVTTAFLVWFFRDPERYPPEDPLAIVAPADGNLRAVETRDDQHRISIVMHGWSVHVNRAPMSGVVKEIKSYSGKHLPIYHKDAPKKNAREDMWIEGKHGTILVSRMVGIVARRIVPWVDVGDKVQRGQRIGIIRLGSQTDLYVPSNWKLATNLQIGDPIKAGETVLAYLPTDQEVE